MTTSVCCPCAETCWPFENGAEGGRGGPRAAEGAEAARGWYLHKRFFVDAGLYATLNGP